MTSNYGLSIPTIGARTQLTDWIPYKPTARAAINSASMTVIASAGLYKVIGNQVTFMSNTNISTPGAGGVGGALFITLPPNGNGYFTPRTFNNRVIGGFGNVTWPFYAVETVHNQVLGAYSTGENGNEVTIFWGNSASTVGGLTVFFNDGVTYPYLVSGTYSI